MSYLKDKVEHEFKVLNESQENEITVKNEHTLKSFYQQLKKKKNLYDEKGKIL